MATANEVKLALDRHAERLRKLGAHGLRTKPGTDFGVRGHVIVASVRPGVTANLPEKVNITVGGAKVSVPVVQKLESYEYERLKAE